MGKIVLYIYLIILLICQAIKGLFIAWLESFQVDMVLLDAMYEEKKVKLSVILSMLGTIPLLLASVFVAKCSLAGKGNVAVQAAVIVCGIMFLKTFGHFLFKKTTYQFIELTEFKVLPIFMWLFKGVECVLIFCLWQELGLGFLVVYLFGSIVHSNALWIKHEMDTFETDMDDMIRTFGGEMTLGSIVIVSGTVLCAVRLVKVGNSTLGLICAAGYLVIQLVKAYFFVFDKGFYKLYHSEKYQEKVPVSENGARLIRKRTKDIRRNLTIKDVGMTLFPVLVAVVVWGVLSGFSMNLFSEGALPWNILILVSMLLYSLMSGGYYGAFHRLASVLVLIPAFILLWESVGNISIPGVLVMYFGMIVYQWDKYQTYT
ncbi:MAG: hypothetical protein E7299_12080 [Lachnospiraceae bacterium]|nr:hypothetical protein [Lachnospiraceae bacterium]MBR4086043.1 hypothetical protein [Lachnospiraceae bacterium]